MTVLLRKTRRLNPLLLQGHGFTRVMSQSLSLLKTLANTAITRKTLSFSCFASQNKEDYMAKNSKKIIALTAAAGAVGAVPPHWLLASLNIEKIKMLIKPPMKSRLIMKMMTLIL